RRPALALELARRRVQCRPDLLLELVETLRLDPGQGPDHDGGTGGEPLEQGPHDRPQTTGDPIAHHGVADRLGHDESHAGCIPALPARDCGSGRQRGAAPGTTGVDDAAAGAGAHPGTEAMLLVTATVVRLERALAHRFSSIMGTDVPLAVV